DRFLVRGFQRVVRRLEVLDRAVELLARRRELGLQLPDKLALRIDDGVLRGADALTRHRLESDEQRAFVWGAALERTNDQPTAHEAPVSQHAALGTDPLRGTPRFPQCEAQLRAQPLPRELEHIRVVGIDLAEREL